MSNIFNAILGKAAAIVFAGLMSIGIVTAPAQVPQASLGSQLPSSPALIDTYLASGIGTADTSMTLASGATVDGIALSGYMCFTIDVNTPTLEYVCGQASSTSITGMLRGIGFSNPNTTSSALAFTHRRFASVQATDYPTLQLIVRQLTGIDSISSTALFYASHPSITSAQQIPDKQYVDSVATSGAANADFLTKGIVQLATTSQLLTGSSTGSTGANLAVGSFAVNQSSTANKIPIANASGQIDPAYYQSSVNTFTAANNFNGTTTVSSTFVIGNLAKGVLLGNGTSAVTTVSPNTTGTILVSNGTTWVATTSGATAKAISIAQSITASSTFVTVNSTTLPAANNTNQSYYISGNAQFTAGNAASTTFVLGGTTLENCTLSSVQWSISYYGWIELLGSNSNEHVRLYVSAANASSSASAGFASVCIFDRVISESLAASAVFKVQGRSASPSGNFTSDYLENYQY